MQKAHLVVRTFKVPGSIQRGIWPPVGICRNLRLPFAMVPSLHQSNIYIKRSLRDWRGQKCNPYFSTKSPHRSAALQNTRFHTSRTGLPVGICENSGLQFAMKPSLQQSNIYIKRKLGEWRVQKCNPYFSARSPLRNCPPSKYSVLCSSV